MGMPWFINFFYIPTGPQILVRPRVCSKVAFILYMVKSVINGVEAIFAASKL